MTFGMIVIIGSLLYLLCTGILIIKNTWSGPSTPNTYSSLRNESWNDLLSDSHDQSVDSYKFTSQSETSPSLLNDGSYIYGNSLDDDYSIND